MNALNVIDESTKLWVEASLVNDVGGNTVVRRFDDFGWNLDPLGAVQLIKNVAIFPGDVVHVLIARQRVDND